MRKKVKDATPELNTEVVNEEQNIAANVDEIMRKYDRESNTRIWEGVPKIVVGIILALFSLFCIYVTLFANFLEQVRLSSFLGLVIVMGYLTYPAKKGKMQANYMPWYDILLMVVGSAAFFYYTFNAETLLNTGLKMKLQDPVYIIAGRAVPAERRSPDPVRCGGVPGLHDLLVCERREDDGEDRA